MLKEYAHEYVQLGIWMHEHGGRLYMATEEPDDPGRPLSSSELIALKGHLKDLLGVCGRLGLKIAELSLQRAVDDPPQTSREFDIYVNVLMDELKSQLFLFVPSGRAVFYQSALALPDFPEAAVELIRAGNCFAVAEYTASVFHSMRSVEVGLEAVRLNLGMPDRKINERSWGNICNDIRDGITAKGKTWAKVDEYMAIHATLVALKDAWRNQTMHVAATYDERDSRLILENTKQFIVRLSGKMDQQGRPMA